MEAADCSCAKTEVAERNNSTVIPSEVEEPRFITFGDATGSFDFASLRFAQDDGARWRRQKRTVGS